MAIDQAYHLRQMVRGANAHRMSSPAPAIIAVSGGKGGVGTTFVARALAEAFGRAAVRTLLVEADLDHGSTALRSAQAPSIADVIAGRASIQQAMQPAGDHVDVLPGAWAPHEVTECSATAQQRLIHELKSIGGSCDAIVVDLGSARNHFVRRFWQSASLVLVVATPEADAVMDAYAAIKVLLVGDTSVPVYSLVNLAGDESPSSVVHNRIRETCRRFLGLRVTAAGEIPEVHNEMNPCFDVLAGTLSAELGLAVTQFIQVRIAS